MPASAVRALRPLIVVGVVVLAASCGQRGLSRDGLRDSYVDRLVVAGVEREAARCIVERLFDDMTDDELRAFNTEGNKLTADQQARVAQLAGACGASLDGDAATG